MSFCCGLTRSKSPSTALYDKKGFSDYVHDKGQAYRHRAIELIRTCQSLSAASEQRFHQDAALTSALKDCDSAIDRAIKSGKNKSQESDHLFEIAGRVLDDYHDKFHPQARRTDVKGLMSEAEKKDEKDRHKSRNSSNDHTLIDVEFHIMSSLPCKNPIVVKQRLSDSIGAEVLAEILWNFSHFENDQRLSLVQNPHFYMDLPNSMAGYGDSFKKRPTDIYRGTVYVLTNNLVPKLGDSRRVFFEFDGEPRAFDNFWDTNDTLIFRDVTGKLEGETVVAGTSIPDKTKNSFWYRMVRTVPPPHQVKAPKYTRDWRNPIRELQGEKFSHTHLRIGSTAAMAQSP